VFAARSIQSPAYGGKYFSHMAIKVTFYGSESGLSLILALKLMSESAKFRTWKYCQEIHLADSDTKLCFVEIFMFQARVY